MHALSLLTPFLLSLLPTLISASPLPTPAYRVPFYSTTSKASTRGNMFAEGVLVEFTSRVGSTYYYSRFPTQPNVAKDCTTWKAISSTDTARQIGIYMSLNGLSYGDFLKLNPDVAREELIAGLSGTGAGLTAGVTYCWSAIKWPEEGGEFVTYLVPLLEYYGQGPVLAIS